MDSLSKSLSFSAEIMSNLIKQEHPSYHMYSLDYAVRSISKITCISTLGLFVATSIKCIVLTNILQMDSPIIINWVSPLSFVGVLGVRF